MLFEVKEFDNIDEVQKWLNDKADTKGIIMKDASLTTTTSNKKTVYTVLIKYELSYKF